MNRPDYRPELLSPAGHWPQMQAAIEAGADAVYFGLNHFSARAKVGFTLDELSKAMELLHSRGVKGFVTFNTLVFDHELDLAVTAIERIAKANVDAVLVQDLGVASLVKQVAPTLDLHGSTQMSITTAEGAEFAQQMGCSRVVLGRELSLNNMRSIASATDVELEVFVHGALCVSYSGQCFSSEAWGGRSANRGQCAQACRLPYDLMVDGEHRPLDDLRYLLSPGDLYALEQIPELIEIGLSCFKIEGRYKSAEYVAATTRAYRQAIDAALENRKLENLEETRNDLEQVYSRGLGSHFVSGVNHQTVVNGRAPRHRGRKAGIVAEVFPHAVVIEPAIELRPGDGVVFDAAHRRDPAEEEQGGFLFEVNPLNETQVELVFGEYALDLSQVEKGDWVWRTLDPQLIKRLKPLVKPQKIIYQRPVDISVVAKVDEPLVVTASLPDSINATFQSPAALQAATTQAFETANAEKQLGRLGGTAFRLGELNVETDGKSFVPVSVLNQARRSLVEQLMAQRSHARHVSTTRVEIVRPTPKPAENNDLRLHVLVRNSSQLDAAIELQPSSITLDYLELYGLRDSVNRIVAAGLTPRVASPRVLKPAEEKIVRFLVSLDSEILVRSNGLLHQLLQLKETQALPRLIGDFSLNVANHVAMKQFLDRGLDCVTPTHDLNGPQVAELAAGCDSHQFEAIAFHHLPIFHTEHCVFCRFLSDGTDHTNCGHPCESHLVSLRDQKGRKHPVLADVGCRNTVFNAEAQFAGKHLDDWVTNGVRNIRIEFVHQTAAEVAAIAGAFSKFCNRELDSAELEKAVSKHVQSGTTEGSFFAPKDFKQLVQLG